VFVIRRGMKDSEGEDSLHEVMVKLAGAISTDEMRKLNYEVDGARRDKKIVVHEWLVKKGFVP
jgi:glycine betaine/choline ABC-type transport system substrate-binding protein